VGVACFKLVNDAKDGKFVPIFRYLTWSKMGTRRRGTVCLGLTAALTLAVAIDPAERYASAVEFERDVTAAIGAREDLGKIMEVLFPPSQRRDLR
jgi:hypothetical protein